MPELETIRVYDTDKARLKEIADATGQKMADVVAEFIRDPDYLCPECEEPFAADEIDTETVEEHGVLSTGLDNLVKGQKEVKSFECPCCEARLSPEDVDRADDGSFDRATRSDIGVTSEVSEPEFSTEEG
jgi:uncharacterized protein YlaI